MGSELKKLQPQCMGVALREKNMCERTMRLGFEQVGTDDGFYWDRLICLNMSAVFRDEDDDDDDYHHHRVFVCSG